MARARQEQMAVGRRAFERGEFFEAHEHWEAAWNDSDGDERRWIQGLIQIATALHKLGARRADLAQSLLVKALAKLHDAPSSLDGLDIARFARDAGDMLATLQRGEAPLRLRIHDGREEH